ncbi:MAG: YbaN family protein [Candidatus Bathyarchaeia archaeon]
MKERECQKSDFAQECQKPGKIKKVLFIVVGTISLGAGIIGILLPVVPTTPFLLLAAACYYKGSRRLHRWMLNNKWFGGYIRNYLQGKGVSLKAKVFAGLLLWITIGVSAVFLVNVLIIQLALFAVAVAVSVHLVMLPTFKES